MDGPERREDNWRRIRVRIRKARRWTVISRTLILKLARALSVTGREALTRAGLGTGLEAEEMPLSFITYKLLSPKAQAIIDRQIKELHEMEEDYRKQD